MPPTEHLEPPGAPGPGRGARKKVLFVDDNADLLALIQELMADFSAGTWEVLAAADVASALAIMRDQVVDLLVTDIHMPVVDGLQFLKLLERKYPNLLKVALTSDSTGGFRAACLNSGAELYLEKPRDPSGWKIVFTTLNELVRFQPEEGFRGVLKRVGLGEVIQLECLANNSSVLEIKTPDGAGAIYIEKGRIVHAQAGLHAGSEAVCFLLSRPGGEFALKPFVEPEARTIAESWEGLLMEASQKIDEFAGEARGLGAVEASGSSGEDTQILVALAEQNPHLTPEPQPARVPEFDRAARPQIEEMLVCSAHGEVLYDWQCANPKSRILFLEFLSQRSRQIGRGLPVGFFDRIELRDAAARVVGHVAADRAVFLRSALAPTT